LAPPPPLLPPPGAVLCACKPSPWSLCGVWGSLGTTELLGSSGPALPEVLGVLGVRAEEAALLVLSSLDAEQTTLRTSTCVHVYTWWDYSPTASCTL
jgi:hypothetical protein